MNQINFRQSLLTACMLIMGGVFSLAPAPVAADSFSLGVQPNYRPEQSQEVFAPLLRYLNQATSNQFSLQTDLTYHHHWKAIHSGEFSDFLVEDGHIADYLINKQGYVAVASAQEQQTYSLVVAETSGAKRLRDLMGRKVATLPAPSLGYIVLSRWYQDPIAQPDIVSTPRSWQDGVEMLFSEEVEAAVIPSVLLERYPNLRVIETSRKYPGMTLLASGETTEEIRQQVKDALLKIHEIPEQHAVLYELDISQFKPAASKDYKGLQKMLSNMYGLNLSNRNRLVSQR